MVGGVVEADLVLPPGDPPAGDQAGGGLHPLGLPRQAGLIAVPADAPGPVAAHLPHRAVAVVKAHPEVPLPLGRLDHHEPVSPQGAVGGAQGPGQDGEGLLRQALLHVVQNDKVVAGGRSFSKTAWPWLLSRYHIGFISAQTGEKIKAGKPSPEDLTNFSPGAILSLYKLFRCFKRKRAATPAPALCWKAGKWACALAPIVGFFAPPARKRRESPCT